VISLEKQWRLLRYSVVILSYLLNATTDFVYHDDIYKPNSVEIGKGEYLPSKFTVDYYIQKGFSVTEISEKKIEYTYEKTTDKAILNFKSEENNLNLELPLIYYKGYKAYIDNEEIKLCQSENGLICINTGDYNEELVIVQYKRTLTQIISCFIGLLSLILFINPLAHKRTK